jgi:ketosteroid isomerase-like protein
MKNIAIMAGLTLFLLTVTETRANPLTQVKTASQKWVSEFNKGNAQYLGESYTMNAVMITHPIGTFHGRPSITNFWVKLIKDGAKDLTYIDPKYTVIDHKTVHITSKWQMNIGSGTITLEQWVKEPDGVWRLQLDDFTIQKQVTPK